MIRGEHVYLTAVQRENFETARLWYNDPSVARWMVDSQVPQTAAEVDRFFDEVDKGDDMFFFEIHVAEDDRFIGMCGLEDYKPVHRNAELGVWVGREEDRGKGYGADAVVTLLRWSFDTMGLNTVYLTALAHNDRAIALYEHLGFEHVGRRRDLVFQDGGFHDLLFLQMLAEDFREKHGGM